MKFLLTTICIISTFLYTAAVQNTARNMTAQILSLKSEILDIKEQLERQQRSLEIKETQKSYGRNCANITTSGIHNVLIPSFSDKPFRVYCDAETRGGGWTVILRRSDGSENFHRKWNIYKKGFGNLDGEFILGLDKIHALTSENTMELLVQVMDFKNDARFETYKRFGIASEEEDYALNTLSKGEGTAGDSLQQHFRMKFSTIDRQNDLKQGDPFPCTGYKAGWWYHACHESLLTGTWGNDDHGWGIIWETFRGHSHSMKTAVMMIRPRIV
ncbi:ficolin-2-like isoform X1 [Drosophila sulfurigaster albostrigata]|uniref:ficolin-2-like isoform X1 n=2 Tax=Drosophila sulfurigaster albostrigata TaxID=89887 RepID=UPI002D21DF86|nr:ficolin-2-like isoform X1 [Drosophila sulfurigaster albostrigata]